MSEQELLEKYNFTDHQKVIIYQAFDGGMDIEKILFFANPKYNTHQMQELYIAFNYYNLTIEDCQILVEEKISFEQMHEILKGIVKGVDKQTLKKYIQKNMSAFDIRKEIEKL